MPVIQKVGQFIDTLAEFGLALWRNWKGFVSGTLLLGAPLTLYQLKTKADVPLAYFLGVLFVGFLVACFLAWHEEHQKREDLGRKLSALRLDGDDGSAALLLRDNAQLRDALDDTKDRLGEVQQALTGLQKSAWRQLDQYDVMIAAKLFKDSVGGEGGEARKHAYYVYAVPTVPDSATVAAHVIEALERMDLHPHRDDGRNIPASAYPLMHMGVFVIGNEQGRVERELVEMLRRMKVGEVVSAVQYVVPEKSTPYDGFPIWIVIGDDGKALQGTAAKRSITRPV